MWKSVVVVLAAVCAVGLCATMTGGMRGIENNDEGARNALNFAVAEHNRKSNEMFMDVAEVTKVQRQLVSGLKYVITATLARTTCRKGALSTDCPVHTDLAMAQPRQCVFTVWTQPWMNKISVMSEECS